MKIVTKIIDVIYDIIKWLTAILMLAMIVITFVEVIRRYVFATNWVWSEELVRYMIVWSTFLGGVAAYRKGALVSFDLLVLKFEKKIQLLFLTICNAIVLGLAAFFLKLGTEAFLKPSIAGNISASLHFSLKWVYLSIPVGFAILILFSLENFYKLAAQFKALKADGQDGKAGEGKC